MEYLVAHGADLCAENLEGLTACDLALRENHHDIGKEFYIVYFQSLKLRLRSGKLDKLSSKAKIYWICTKTIRGVVTVRCSINIYLMYGNTGVEYRSIY